MTKEITKAYIIQQIQDKFKLREMVPEVFSLSEMVIPTYDIEQHLKAWETHQKSITVTEATGRIVFVVPENERWVLSGYTVIFITSDAFKVAGCYILRKNSDTVFIYLDLTKNQTTSYTVNLPKPLTFDSGDSLNINIDHYTSEGTLHVNSDVIKEELR